MYRELVSEREEKKEKRQWKNCCYYLRPPLFLRKMYVRVRENRDRQTQGEGWGELGKTDRLECSNSISSSQNGRLKKYICSLFSLTDPKKKYS